MGGRQGGWERGEAAVALETMGDLKRQPPLLGAVVRLLNLRGVAEQQQRQSGQLPQPRFRVPEKILSRRRRRPAFSTARLEVSAKAEKMTAALAAVAALLLESGESQERVPSGAPEARCLLGPSNASLPPEPTYSNRGAVLGLAVRTDCLAVAYRIAPFSFSYADVSSDRHHRATETC